MQTISLLVLIVAIAIGFWQKHQCRNRIPGPGLYLDGRNGDKRQSPCRWFSNQAFSDPFGNDVLFALLQDNQTLELLSRKIISLFKTRPFLMPVVIYVVSYVMSAAGPGAISVQSVMVIFAVSLAVQMKANPILMAVMAILGAVGGTASPIALTGIIVKDLTASLHVPGIAVPVFTALRQQTSLLPLSFMWSWAVIG